MAQMHSTLTFVGESSTTVLTSTTESASDSLSFSMTSATTGDITFPAMSGMNQTIPSFTVSGATFSMGANHVVTFADQTFTSTVTVDEVEKTVTGSSLTGEYNMSDNSLTLTAVFKYGSMPFDLTYTVKAYYLKSVTGDIKVDVGSAYHYSASNVGYKIRKYYVDGVETIDVEIPMYKIAGTVMGDLTLGRYVVSGLTYDSEKGGFYRDYSADGLSLHFTAESNGVKSMDGDYDLSATDSNNILVTYDSNGTTVTSIVNNLKPGQMPFPITTTFSSATAAISDIVAPEAQTNGQAYDIMGRRVGANAKGIVIMHGKKYIRK